MLFLEPMDSRSTQPPVTIAKLNKQGLGVAADPPTGVSRLYLAGAIPGEQVHFRIRAKKSRVRWGITSSVIAASPHRVQPRCQHAPGNSDASASVCGGCSLQHIHYAEQLRIKQAQVMGLFAECALEVEHWDDPLTGEAFGYRHQARIGVRWVTKKSRLLVGFRESMSNRITDCTGCEVLVPRIGTILEELTKCLEELHIADQIPQVEVASGDSHAALVIRHLQPLGSTDVASLGNFGLTHGLGIFTQSGGPHTIAPLFLPEDFSLDYAADGLRFCFSLGNFIQNNLPLNRKMVAQAMDWLQPQSHESLIDLFCGIGNFSLPIAKRAKALTGVEVSEQSVMSATNNAKANHIDNAHFYAADLSNTLALEQQQFPWWNLDYDAALLDPPRSGAAALSDWLIQRVRSRLLYISCNPESLVKDLLGLSKSYRIACVGIVDMFAHTNHCEVMCLLVKRC